MFFLLVRHKIWVILWDLSLFSGVSIMNQFICKISFDFQNFVYFKKNHIWKLPLSWFWSRAQVEDYMCLLVISMIIIPGTIFMLTSLFHTVSCLTLEPTRYLHLGVLQASQVQYVQNWTHQFPLPYLFFYFLYFSEWDLIYARHCFKSWWFSNS